MLFVDSENCGETNLEGHFGTISSPNYPLNYSSETSCLYTIHAPERVKVYGKHLYNGTSIDWLSLVIQSMHGCTFEVHR